MQLIDKRIISASRRTDIPAFYPEWLMNRIKAGYCTVPNPFNSNQVARIGLTPEEVLVFVFWTKNASKMMKYLDELDKSGYKYYFQYTVNGYPKTVERFAPDTAAVIHNFRELSEKIGPEKVVWRYDPIIISDELNNEWHKKNFSQIYEELKSHTKRLVISFVDPYKKTVKALSGQGSMKSYEDFQDKYIDIARYIAKTAAAAGIKVVSCAEEADLAEAGIEHGKCIDDSLISELLGEPLAMKKDKYQRKACGCVESKDIGMNDSCLHGCTYCYATRSFEAAQKNRQAHDPTSPSMLGWHEPRQKDSPEQVKLWE